MARKHHMYITKLAVVPLYTAGQSVDDIWM